MQYEPRHEKTGFWHMQKQVTAQLISAFVFTTGIVESLFFLDPKFQTSSYLLWLYSPVCVGPGHKPRRPVFSERGSYFLLEYADLISTKYHVSFYDDFK